MFLFIEMHSRLCPFVLVAGNQHISFGTLINFCSDRCYLQKRVLNSSKGPAVRALRAQTDKREYAIEMRKVVERSVYQGSVKS